MDGQEYLNQISGSVRPVKPQNQSTLKKIISSIYFKLGAGGIAALIVIMIIGTALTSGNGGLETQLTTLKLRLDRTTSLINTYQKSVKSSNLRSSSASLYAVLTSTDTNVSNYLEERYEYKESNVSKDLISEADLEQEALDTDLFNAKITGVLDRTYAHKMAYEISWITTKEAAVIKATKDATLSEMLTTSYNSLATLYDQFDNFSEAK